MVCSHCVRSMVITPAEQLVLTRVTAGESNKTIAAALGVSEQTIKSHVSSLFCKTGTENRTQLAVKSLIPK